MEMARADQDNGEDRTLDRSLGLIEALTIGTGTMIGAGIFVFPGIAAGRAGMAATLSFGLGALIALLVALCTSELATAMPESGGGYYYVSRGFGFFAGTLVGIGQWLGLIFASSFYLAGFGHYFRRIMSMLDLGGGVPVSVLAFSMGVLILVVNLFGTENSGGLQNLIVTSLIVLLLFILGYGMCSVFGVTGEAPESRPFAPRGFFPILTTAALVFTSYLGFAQIATVAGEISKPSVNLPLSMVGGVLLVGSLYVLAVFVSTRLFGASRLAEMGETAMIEVARSLFGTYGAFGMIAAGLLATVSSANASILSSSRAVYALSKDGMVPEWIARVNKRFGTPHYSLIITGALILSFLFIGGLERLAEVASLLHLIMYGLICFALVQFRSRERIEYEPAFRMWGPPILPVIGGVCSFALIGFMNSSSLVLGGLVLVVAAVWYRFRNHFMKRGDRNDDSN